MEGGKGERRRKVERGKRRKMEKGKKRKVVKGREGDR